MRVMSASSSFASTAVGTDGGDIARGRDCGRAREIDTASRVGDARGARGESGREVERDVTERGRGERETDGRRASARDGDARGGAGLGKLCRRAVPSSTRRRSVNSRGV